MSWVIIIVDINDNNVKINWFYLRKSSSAQFEEISYFI